MVGKASKASQISCSVIGHSPAHAYIQSARLNGRPLEKPVLTYAQIRAGGKLEFVMGPEPSSWAKSWRAAADAH